MASATRDRIVETARRLFWEQGYTATGVAQILKEANVLSGSLYYFFPTKDDLLLAVLEMYQELLEPMVVAPVFARVADPIERIFGILAGYRQLLTQTKFQQGCPIGNLALEVGHALPAARKLIAANMTGWRQAIEQCLADAADRLPADLDRERLALFVLTTMEGAVMLARAYHSLDAYDSAIALLRDYFDRLLAQSAPRKARPHRRQPRST
jgi:TetR/AcrR family transcriptional regulator, transcriptional repressor for nem operon